MKDSQREHTSTADETRHQRSGSDAGANDDLSGAAILLSATNTADLLSWFPALAEDLHKYLLATDGTVSLITYDGHGEELLDPLSRTLGSAPLMVISATPSAWRAYCRAGNDTGWTPFESDAVGPLLLRLRCGWESSRPIVSVAFDAQALAAVHAHTDANIYVGPEDLKLKHSNTVPLTGQGLAGALNFVRYASRKQRTPLIRFRDLLSFAERSHRFYSAADAPATMRQRAISAAGLVIQEYPAVRAVFGTGYPFYISDHDGAGSTPTSILRYLRAQRAYFRSKIYAGPVFSRQPDAVMTHRTMRALGLRLGRGRFDRSWYVKFGVPYTPLALERASLREYHQRNAFDLEGDLWPCELCTHLQDAYLYPEQQRRRGFNEECLSCMQTSLSERNVMACASDVDLLIVVDGDPLAHAEQLQHRVRSHGACFVHDSQQYRSIRGGESALDAFVVNSDVLSAALVELSMHGEAGHALEAYALWVPIRRVDLDLAGHFAIAFELLEAPDAQWQSRLERARRGYAKVVNDETLPAVLQARSFYLRQLLGSVSVTARLRARLRAWRKQDDAVVK